jgi:SAM-dependent methyltransferase
MKTSKLFEMWRDFNSATINMSIHKDDEMYNTAHNKPGDYTFVGMSGLDVVISVLGVAPTQMVESILDFGCGHGRVGRYLRAFFPGADMTFADVDPSCAQFCAGTFNGTALTTQPDFSLLSFPGKYDLIWLGSVFTHIDYNRMKVLFDKLFGALKRDGVLIGTFRGEQMYRTYLRSPAVAKRDADLIQEYEAKGVAHKTYPNGKDDWGLSLVKPQKLMELGSRSPEARMISYAEVAWANAHDVVAWTNTSPQTIIR